MDKRTELETDKGRTEDDARRVYMYIPETLKPISVP